MAFVSYNKRVELKHIVYVTMDLQGALLCFLAAGCVFLTKRLDERLLVCLAGIEALDGLSAVGDAIAWGFRGVWGQAARVSVYAGNFLNFFASYAVVPVFLEYVLCSVEQKKTGSYGRSRGKDVFSEKSCYLSWKKRARILIYSSSGINILLLIITQYTGWIYYIDKDNLYHRGELFFIISALGVVQLTVLFLFVLRFRERLSAQRMAALLCYVVLPILAVTAQHFVYGYSISTIVSIVCAIFMFAEAYLEQAVRIRDNERLIKEAQMRIAVSQIKPHFLFNVLSSIYYLVGMDSDRCRGAISDFSEYLRGNISSVYSETPIPVEQELQHTKAYLALEELRLQGKLTVRYDIRENNFRLPALSIQPLAENAVRHGIWKKGGKGTLTISTARDKDGYVVSVEDDGTGFSPEERNGKAGAGEDHIGLSNVRDRLEMMMGATMEIESTVGKGTVIRIRIPEQKAKGRG